MLNFCCLQMASEKGLLVLSAWQPLGWASRYVLLFGKWQIIQQAGMPIFMYSCLRSNK